LFPLVLALAAAAADPIGWDALPSAIDDAWARGPGAVVAARLDGTAAASRAEPWGAPRLDAQTAPVIGGSGPLFDDNTSIVASMSIGGRRAARRAWWEAQTVHLASAAHAEKLAFADEARALWLDAWVAGELAEHLTEHAAELEARVATLQAGVAEGLVSTLTIGELEVEVGRLRAEAAVSSMRAEVARVALSGHLGADVDVALDSLPAIEEDLPDAPNPWDEAIARVQDLPSLRAMQAAVDAADAEAAALRRSAPPEIGVGGIWRNTDRDIGPPGPLFTVGIPLGNPDAPAARDAAGRAEALRRALAFAVQRQTAALRAERAALASAEGRHALMRDRVEGPLVARVARLTEAVAAGAAPVQLLLLARRDLHEAFHARADAAAEVRVRRARGQALAAWLRAEENR
jgi:hypothetical protein